MMASRSETWQRRNLLNLGSGSPRHVNVGSAHRSPEVAAGSVCTAAGGIGFNDDTIPVTACVLALLSHADWVFARVVCCLGETWWWNVVPTGLRGRGALLGHAFPTCLWLWLGWGLRGCKWSLAFFTFRAVAHGAQDDFIILVPSFSRHCTFFLQVAEWNTWNEQNGKANIIKPFSVYVHSARS